MITVPNTLFCAVLGGLLAWGTAHLPSLSFKLELSNFQVLIATNHTMHESWDRFREIKKDYESKFGELICTDPDQLINMQKQLKELVEKVLHTFIRFTEFQL